MSCLLYHFIQSIVHQLRIVNISTLKTKTDSQCLVSFPLYIPFKYLVKSPNMILHEVIDLF